MLIAACTGQIGPQAGDRAPGAPRGSRLAAAASGTAGEATGHGERRAGPATGLTEEGATSPRAEPVRGPSASAADVGRVGIHRLNNQEYDHTMRDLLGVASTPARSFIADAKAAGFDNIASALGMTSVQYEQYFQSADALVEQVWAAPSLRARILTCSPASSSGDECRQRVLRDFGLRAYRRPLRPDELERLQGVARAAEALGEPFDRAIAQTAKAMLASPGFLYRVELDPSPISEEPHPLSPYELASRLSYLLWSTMPDEQLLSLAADGSLVEEGTLRAEVDRMLSDPRSARFANSFAGQWLGLRGLSNHQTDTSVYPAWSDSLRDAMVAEGLAYFDEFLHGTRGMDTFFTADVNFVDAELAQLYGFSGGPFDPAQPHSDANDARRGFLGLASFLTLSSFSYRTAPTLRGKWVQNNLLCTELPPPPGDVPQLDDDNEDPKALASLNVRQRLAAHRVNPGCAGCHRVLDPIGLGLEHFDGIGRYRERYDNGDAIDASGELPDGSRFEGLESLSTLLSDEPRVLACAVEKLLTYALGRTLTGGDAPHLDRIRQGWQRDGLGLWALIERIVLSEPFRMRRGESET